MLEPEQREIHGLPVRILNTCPEIHTAQVIERLGLALDLIATYAPRCYRRLGTDLAGFVGERFACRGAFFPMSRECRVELTFTVNPQVSLPEIAASIVHEATHARAAHRCGSLPPEGAGREAARRPGPPSGAAGRRGAAVPPGRAQLRARPA